MGHGLILFLLSVILSRGIDRIQSDMDHPSNTLLGRHSYCTQELVNLILIGSAISNIHNHNINFGDTILKGATKQSSVGQLSLFEHYDNLTVGTFFKNPIYPVWVVCAESHYTVIFSKSSPNDIFYYDGLAGQSEEIRLTIKESSVAKVQSESPLENCIRTRWKNADIDWNGSEVLL
jgi:hypothetical protein